MSKKIDTSDLSKLSPDDLQYLLDRGKIKVEDIPKGADIASQPGDSTSTKSDEGDDLDDMTVSKLKDEAEKRDLSKGGSKQDLIDRIREYDAAADDELVEE